MVPSSPVYRPFGALRFLLALAVVASHTFEMAFADGHLVRRIGIGNIAVMSFFILSGFIITEALTTFYANRPFAFMANRLARIVPPYWAALTVSVVIHAALAWHGPVRMSPTETMPPSAFDAVNLIENALAIFARPSELTFVQDHPFYGFVRFYWAIYIELLFYGAVFVVAALAAIPSVKRRQLGPAIAIAAITGATVLHISGEYAGRELLAFPGRWGLTFTPYFLTGVFLYFSLTHWSRAALIGLAISYGLMALHFSRYVQHKIPLSDAWAHGLLEPGNAIPILMLLGVPGLLKTLAYTRAGRIAPIDWRLGSLSYPIYLNHWVVIVALYTLTDEHGYTVQATAIAASIALSWLLMHVVETPMASLRDRLRGRPLWAESSKPAERASADIAVR